MDISIPEIGAAASLQASKASLKAAGPKEARARGKACNQAARRFDVRCDSRQQQLQSQTDRGWSRKQERGTTADQKDSIRERKLQSKKITPETILEKHQSCSVQEMAVKCN